MVAAGLGFAFMPVNMVKHPGVIGLPVVEPEFWRQVSLVSVRGRRYSPGVGSLVREAMRKTWFGIQPERAMESEGALEPAERERVLRRRMSDKRGRKRDMPLASSTISKDKAHTFVPSVCGAARAADRAIRLPVKREKRSTHRSGGRPGRLYRRRLSHRLRIGISPRSHSALIGSGYPLKGEDFY